MTQYARGTMVFFSAAFVDKAGAPVTPDSAVVSLVFRGTDKVQRYIGIDMTVSGNVAEATWDSSVAAPGTVYWSVKGTGVNAIVQDGEFTLTAGLANQ